MTGKNNFNFKDAFSRGKQQLDSEMKMLTQQEQLVKELQEAKSKEFQEKDRVQAAKALADVFGREKSETVDWLGESTYIPSWLKDADNEGYLRWNVLLPGLPEDYYIFVTRPPYHATSVYMGYIHNKNLERIENLADFAAAIQLLTVEDDEIV